MGRKSRMLGAVAMAIALLAAGCGDDDGGDASPAETTAGSTGGTTATSAATATTEAPTTGSTTTNEDEQCTAARKGGTLTVGEPAYSAGLDPAQVTGAAATTGGIEMTAIYDTLMRWNTEKAVYEPQVAQSLTPNADSSVWTLKLRPNVKFGNGDPLTADAVIASIERLRGARVSAASFVQLMTSMVAPDPMTVVFTLNAPWGDFPYFLAGSGGMIVNRAVASSMTPEAFNLNPTGAGVGPFELKRYAPKEEVVLSAKPDYWGGVVCVDEVRVISPQGDQALLEALKLGEIDLTVLEADPRYTAQAKEEGFPGAGAVSQASQLMINTVPGQPGADVNIRRALVAAIDLDLINTRVYDGTGVFASTIVPPDSALAVQGLTGPKYDPTLASSW